MFTWSTLQGANGESYSTWFLSDVYIYIFFYIDWLIDWLIDLLIYFIYMYSIHAIIYSILFDHVHCISKSTIVSPWYPLEPKVLTQLLIESLRFTSKACGFGIYGGGSWIENPPWLGAPRKIFWWLWSSSEKEAIQKMAISRGNKSGFHPQEMGAWFEGFLK